MTTSTPPRPLRQPSRARRRLGLIAICAGLLLLLTGCVQYRIDITLDGRDTVHGTVAVGYSAELLGVLASAGSLDPNNPDAGDPLAQLEADLLSARESISAGTVDVEPYEDGEYSGFRATYGGVPLAEFGSAFEELSTSPGSTEPSSGAGMTIVRDGDRYVFEAALGDSFTGSDQDAMDSAELLRDADLRFTVTFPGPVLESDGQISGNVVTWGTEQLLATDTIRAVGVAAAPGPFGGAGGGSAVVVIAIGATAALAVLGTAGWALTANRRARNRALGGAVAGHGGGWQ